VDRSLKLVTAESLTCGMIANTLGAVEGSSEWLCGGIVAYVTETKFTVLGVTPGPVITERCAREMAEGAKRLFGADIAVSVTGVGGPGPEEDQPAGTVFIGVAFGDEVRVQRLRFAGGPEQVLGATTRAAIASTLEVLTQGGVREVERGAG